MQPVPAILLPVSSDGFGRSSLSAAPARLPKGVKISLQYVWSNRPFCPTGNELSASPADPETRRDYARPGRTSSFIS
jgi:hypothetical protein